MKRREFIAVLGGSAVLYRLCLGSPSSTCSFQHDTHAEPSGVVRGPLVGEFGKQIAVRPDLIPRHLPIGEDS